MYSQSNVPQDRLPALDGWRGLAITLVLIQHFFPWPLAMDTGRFGVDVFFCLSGLLMSNILFVRRTNLAKFYKRRASRILPVFLLFTTLIFIVSWVDSGTFLLDEFIPTLLFLRTYLPVSPSIWSSSLPIGHFWSLNVEEHCYLVLGLLALFIARRIWAAISLGAISLLSIGILLAYVKFPHLAPASGTLGTECVAANLMISASYCLVCKRLTGSIAPWTPILALGLAACCYLESVPWWLSILVAPLLLAFAVNHLIDLPTSVRKLFEWPPLRYFGIWSYSIYIWQQPFYAHRGTIGYGSALLLAFLVAMISYYWIESPVRNWLNKNW